MATRTIAVGVDESPGAADALRWAVATNAAHLATCPVVVIPCPPEASS